MHSSDSRLLFISYLFHILALLPTGSYAGFDETQPTSQQDGKAQVIEFLKSRYDYNGVVMIGDGATDLLASPPAVRICSLTTDGYVFLARQ